jgi:glutathione S-transferase
MYRFFYAPKSCSLASHIALEQAGATYEAIKVNLGENEQREDKYLSINPKGS